VSYGQGTNMLEHDDNRYFFGFVAGLNSSTYRIFHSNYFLDSDSVQKTNPLWEYGFHAGITGNIRLGKHLGVRLAPMFAFTNKQMEYDLKYAKDTLINVESILLHTPIDFKFSSDRISNFRFYVLGGVKYDYDFNSNVRSRRDDEVFIVSPSDYGYNLGFGFDFYYPNYILSPEIKISNGLGNVQKLDPEKITSRVFDQINTRMVTFSILIGG
jgi:hypothetical protein